MIVHVLAVVVVSHTLASLFQVTACEPANLISHHRLETYFFCFFLVPFFFLKGIKDLC